MGGTATWEDGGQSLMPCRARSPCLRVRNRRRWGSTFYQDPTLITLHSNNFSSNLSCISMVYRDCFTGTRLYFDSQDGLAKSERIVRLRLSVFGSESDHRFEDPRSHERGRLGPLASSPPPPSPPRRRRPSSPPRAQGSVRGLAVREDGSGQRDGLCPARGRHYGAAAP